MKQYQIQVEVMLTSKYQLFVSGLVMHMQFQGIPNNVISLFIQIMHYFQLLHLMEFKFIF